MVDEKRLETFLDRLAELTEELGILIVGFADLNDAETGETVGKALAWEPAALGGKSRYTVL